MRLARRFRVAALGCVALLPFVGCTKKEPEVPQDYPRLTRNVVLRDVTFRSVSLGRDVQYRVILPATIKPNEKLPVVYLLHGGAGNFRDWSNYSDVARFAERGLILVMPDGDESYYTNSRERPQDRYEDFIICDLIQNVEAKFPALSGRANRSIIGVSMGGYGAVKLALHHPDLYQFAGGLSSAIDVPSRPFSIKRVAQWRHYSSIFGAWGTSTRRNNDPFVLVRSADPAKMPYFFLTCGELEGLLPANRNFAALLAQRNIPYEFHTVHAGHDWNQWNSWLDVCFQSLFAHLATRT